MASFSAAQPIARICKDREDHSDLHPRYGYGHTVLFTRLESYWDLAGVAGVLVTMVCIEYA
jgi:hypothetical protein